MDADTIQSLLGPALAANGILVNDSHVQQILGTLLPSVASLPPNLTLPLLTSIMGLEQANGSILLAAVNSTAIGAVLTALAPISNAIPLNTTATLITQLVGAASAAAGLMTVSNATLSAVKGFVTAKVLPALMTLPANVTTPLIQNGLGALAMIPQNQTVPVLQKAFLAVGSSLHNVSLGNVNMTAVQNAAYLVLPALLTLPKNVTMPLFDNAVTAITTMPTNESVPLLKGAGEVFATVPKNQTGAVAQQLAGLIFPANGTMTDGTRYILTRIDPILLLANDNAAPGTGIKKLVAQAKSVLGPKLPKQLVDFTLDQQLNLFGDYPSSKDVAPLAIFTALFAILALLHLGVFAKNYSRGHKFWLSVGWVIYCIFRVLGFGLRIAWSRDITNTDLGIANEVFLIVPSLLLISFNLVLAQRIFTWRHPVGGSMKFFWAFMLLTYALVVAVITMTIVAQLVPYLYFLSEGRYSSCKKVVEASGILFCLYALLALSLVSLSFFFKPTQKDKDCFTFQPWWIHNFGPLYFVEKNAYQNAAESFVARSKEEREAVRVIAATHHHSNSVNAVTTERGDLGHNTSLVIITLTSLMALMGAICRCIAIFQDRTKEHGGNICKPALMYVCWGALEVIINVLYLVGRVDLRFYRPDHLSKKILNAPQSEKVEESQSEGEKEVSNANSLH